MGQEIPKKSEGDATRLYRRRFSPILLGVSTCISLALAVWGGIWIYYERYSLDRFSFSDPPNSTAADQYYQLDFKPRFHRDQCIVRFDYFFHGPRVINPSSVLFTALIHYLYEYEPKAVVFDISGRNNSLYVQFSDQCDRRFEISDAFAKKLRWRFPEFDITVSHDQIDPGPETIDVFSKDAHLEDKVNQ